MPIKRVERIKEQAGQMRITAYRQGQAAPKQFKNILQLELIKHSRFNFC